ncbi:ubiquitin carboxyl-terminal hydrolase 24 isoform X7 [Pipistrellus kuhlii]|uniref:ubiquitin carboxyl-terminal hydrolase 24 isoform X7 n=1 Tax=Pipistrellus kuhlii TaxID=59472 RepID=UPI001E274B3E|nr:ubiquitin carboxyl-terminal hydrolase 24 isoform X7 [Pipistrellus kuhlii]
MESEEEQHMTTLLCMGFSDPATIRKALRLAKNDINEAVALLTNERPGLDYGGYEPMDSGGGGGPGPGPGGGPRGDGGGDGGPSRGGSTTGGGSGGGGGGGGGFDPPPAYHEVVDAEKNDENGNCSGEGIEFPTTNLYELESRVLTDHWSIPYKREESLGKCLLASTYLARLGLSESDENCKRFMDRCMPEAFKKLLTSSAVHKWGTEIHEGIYNMLMLLIELVAERIKQDPIPIGLLGVLTMAFNPDNEYHFKNRMKVSQRNWAEVFGEGNMFAISPVSTFQKEPHGWVVDLVNKFGELGGFAAIQAKLRSEDIELGAVSALVQPLGVCAEYLNSSVVQPMLDPVILTTIQDVRSVEEKDLKDKRLVSIPELLSAIKLLCMRFQPELVTVVDDLRLDILLRMLKSPHFSAKMNSLKEVTKLIEDSTLSKSVKNAIDTDRLLDWLVENSVLSIALEGNIDQAQYCDRIKGIIELLGSKLSLDELTKIWKIQSGQSSTVIENIHTIIAAAAVKFNSDQLNHLFVLIQKSWETESDRVRQKLLSLIGRIGREARFETTSGKVLDVLWELAHLPTLPSSLIQQALDEHLTILSDAYAVKEAIKRSYIIKCIEDIKRPGEWSGLEKKKDGFKQGGLTGDYVSLPGYTETKQRSSQLNNPQFVWVVPALRQLHEITRSFIKQTYQKQDKSIIQDLKKNFEIVKLVTGSLIACHRLAAAMAGPGGLTGSTLVDGRYTYREYLEAHLKFLAFFLQEATLYLGWNRAKEIWECLVTGQDVCELDREMCFEWFTKGQHDLESDVQQQLFKEKILKLESYEITMNGFNLFKTFFENVNLCDHRLKRQGAQLDSVSLHKKFIADCYTRLEAASSALGGPTLTHAVTRATKMLTATAMPTVATSVQSPYRSTKLVIIERLLLLAERYVITIEDFYSVLRTILPHGASFHGHLLTLNVTYESTKDTFTVEAHSNETIGSVRWKIAKQLCCPVDNIQIFTNDSLLTVNKDQKLLHQLGFSDEQILTVKTSGSGTPSGSSADSSTSSSSSSSGVFSSSYAMEQEKSLPGVVMALVCNVFDMLYQLANLEEPRITLRVRKLLLLIPTDPAIQEALDQLDSLGRKKTLLSETSSQSSKSPSLSSKQQHQPSASSILESLFRSFAPGMSTFRVLYNLEVLSSKLMPTADDDMARNCAKSFCENFLKAGGLSLVVNVMQRDSIPSEVDYETRQGVYSICLQLARFLLVGQTMPTLLDEDIAKDGIEALSSRPFRNVSRQTSRQISLCGTPEKSSYRQLSVSDRSSIRVEEIIPAARVAIQTMEVNDFTSTVACFMRLSWAAAAGRLDLVGSSQPIKESNSLFPAGIRNRLSSSGSNCSSGSEGEPVALHAGICVRQQSVSTKDSLIAGEALSLLVTCLQLRSQQLTSFYNLPCVADFIIDILLGSPSAEIRRVACDQLYTLSQTDTSTHPDVQKPNQFLLGVILTAQLPLWSPTSIMRGINQRLLSQCMEYFDLRCQLLDDLTTSEMEQLRISPATMLEDEITWLDNFEPNRTAECETSEADNILLAGHLRLIKTLLSLCGAEKEMLGSSLIKPLLDDFLFRASRIILNSHSPAGSAAISQQDFHPKCSTVNSRLAAYEVLVMLADSSPSNLQIITKELLSMHHQPDPALTKEFDYLPPVDSRSSAGFVGLRNGGATCYMNAVFQQLYMQPGLPEALLSVDDDTDNPDDSVFYQVQSLFGHLMESKLQYYVPENFWKIFKMWNKELYVREQQDAYEFFTSLIDQMDEYLKKMGRDQIFKNTFQGIYSDQKICKDCPHRYEREEAFMALNLGVTSCQSLEISLDQFVRGEVLEGSNAYYCEKCKEKRITVKRTCIKSLPSVLVIHLMRFGFDWESGRSIKYDEQIKFPWMLNMEPYTVSGMARQDSSSEVGENGRSMDQGGGGSPRKKVALTENYELVGVIVHSGQAHAGHYYSFIKDRRGCGKGKWYKFNDTVIEEFDLNDETLEYECFGGEYRPKVYDQTNPYTDVRRRYWNAYMLFYQRVSDQNSPVLPKKSRVSVVRQEAEDLSLSAPSSPEISPQSSPRPHRPNNDRLSILTKLVKKGEKKGLFVEKMPVRIYQMVRDENLKFMKNRDVYSSDYFSFVLSLASLNAVSTGWIVTKTKLKHPYYPCMAKVSLQLAIQFLFQTYLRTKKKLRVDTEEWIATIEALLSKSFDACQWLVEYFIGSEGRELIKIFLLECNVREVRVAVATILEKTLDSALFYQDKLKSLHQLLEVLLALLDKDVPENCKNCAQYFFLFNTFVQKQGIRAGDLLLRHSALRHMISFLLGASRQNNQIRRWSSAQAREFGNLHNTVALLVLYSDVSSQRNVAPGVFKQRPPISIAPSSPLLPLHEEVEALLFLSEGKPYLLEVMFALRELTGSLLALMEMVVYCCFCNEHFSFTMLHFIKNQLETAPPHELKNTFQLLHEILVIEDPIQVERVKFVFETENGLLALMHHSNHVDSSRCYQCVKFLVTLAQKCPAAKEYFKENSHHWSWAVQWLQKKMSEHYWTPQSNVSNETSTGKTFQRTISAQDTLAYATALLNEKEQSGSSNGSESSPANENGDRHLQQGSESPMMIGELRSDLDDVDP